MKINLPNHMESIYLRDPDGNLIEVSNYPAGHD
jgi:hypothetical protein